MLSYRHLFHAGNFADVHKHAMLSLLLQSLTAKSTPFCYHDTHAGAGRYDLQGLEINKNAEYRDGILRLLAGGDMPPVLASYVAAVWSCNTKRPLRYYPGSPRIARHILRPQDRMVLTELNRVEHQLLRQEFARDRTVAVHQLDAYQGLKALLPPREKRGLIFIDPAYERRGEMERMTDALTAATRRWTQGIYAMWHPITNRTLLERFYHRLERSGVRKILVCELHVRAALTARRLNGSCMAVVNPPFHLKETLQQLMPWLALTLAQQYPGTSRTQWLVPE